VAVDKDQMIRVFTNIINNSIAAIESESVKGLIQIRTFLLDEYNLIRVEVSDNGCGIPDHLKQRVLEPYFSTKRDGTGLGLAIVHQIVTDHGGYLRILDNADKGTIVAIELPLEDNKRGTRLT
jgi:two-component system nitrogen regulation sensor histidine kinase NtrY